VWSTASEPAGVFYAVYPQGIRELDIGPLYEIDADGNVMQRLETISRRR
jgi:hypothetical protein